MIATRLVMTSQRYKWVIFLKHFFVLKKHIIVLYVLVCRMYQVTAKFDALIRSFPILFSDKSDTVKGLVSHLDLTDSTAVRSRPYHDFHPRL
jgi:hypothetical protein